VLQPKGEFTIRGEDSNTPKHMGSATGGGVSARQKASGGDQRMSTSDGGVLGVPPEEQCHMGGKRPNVSGRGSDQPRARCPQGQPGDDPPEFP
jgi:hypothetical protein